MTILILQNGKGNWATIPWISLLDNRETTTTQAGTYVVYLFNEGGQGMHLKLAQGVTQVQKEGGNVAERLKENAAAIAKQCQNLKEHGYDLSGEMRLETDGKLGKLYEASTIATKIL